MNEKWTRQCVCFLFEYPDKSDNPRISEVPKSVKYRAICYQRFDKTTPCPLTSQYLTHVLLYESETSAFSAGALESRFTTANGWTWKRLEDKNWSVLSTTTSCSFAVFSSNYLVLRTLYDCWSQVPTNGNSKQQLLVKKLRWWDSWVPHSWTD